jgi:hypothetical protein
MRGFQVNDYRWKLFERLNEEAEKELSDILDNLVDRILVLGTDYDYDFLDARKDEAKILLIDWLCNWGDR